MAVDNNSSQKTKKKLDTQHIRTAAEYFADLTIIAVKNRIQNREIINNFSIDLEYDRFHVSATDEMFNTEKLLFDPVIPLFDIYLKNFIGYVIVRWNPQTDLLENESSHYVRGECNNSMYCLGEDTDDNVVNNIIATVTVELPKNMEKALEYIEKNLRFDIMNTTVHELRHAIQFSRWGWDAYGNSLNTEKGATDYFINNICEIDARVEQVCSHTEKNIYELSLEDFFNLFFEFIIKYSARVHKGKLESWIFNNLEEIIAVHCEHFSKRILVSEMACPL